jgi:hypothetical protein
LFRISVRNCDIDIGRADGFKSATTTQKYNLNKLYYILNR